MTFPYLPAGALCAEFSEVFMYGSTDFSNNIADRYGGDHGCGRLLVFIVHPQRAGHKMLFYVVV